jgi:TonB-linked SusC/RagA family outer membrane protein
MISKFIDEFLRQRFIYIKWLLMFLLAFQLTAFGQEKQVTGKVTDASGAPLPGVNVVIKGTQTGVFTDNAGNFTILARPEDVLVFSSVGFIPEEYQVGSRTVIDVALEEEVIGMEEVVVIGYGTQKKKLNTGANINIDGDIIKSLNTTSSMDALKGLTPGVSITQNNGVPGAGNKIFIRGIGTIGNFNPLYIVDGVAVGDIDNLSPADIEDIDILKDAASAAIYGSRGANGVVLVTTKRGKLNTKPIVNYSGYYGWQNIYKRPELLNAQEYVEAMNEANENVNGTPFNYERDVPYWDRIQSGEWKGTNWLEIIEDKNAPVQSHSFNITGGSESSTYSLGASYYEQQGILGKQANNDYKRINLRLNSEHILATTKSGRSLLILGENLTYTNEKNPTIRTGNIYWNDLHNMLVASPFLPMYADSLGDYAYPYHYAISWNLNESNPVAEMILQSKYNTNNNNTLIGNAYLELQPIKNLKLRSTFGVNNYYGSSRQWIPAYNYSVVSSNTNDQVNQSMYSGFTWTSTNTITYSYNLMNMHNFTVLAGTEATKNASDLSINGHNENSIFKNPDYAYLDNFGPLDAENVALANFGGRDNYGWAMLSYFGRFSYDFKEKYLLTAVLRYDGSSNFDRGHRWGTFPSIAAGWVVTNESFMESLSGWLNFLKLRTSWGQNGNQDIQKFVYLSSILLEGQNYFFGPDHSIITVGSAPARVPNPDVSWETSEQINIGFDMNVLNNRLQFSFDWYQKDTKDWLINKISSAMDGTNPPVVNGGLIRNKGLETILRWNGQTGSLKYNVTGTFAYNKNKVIEVPSSDSIFHGPANVLSQGTSEMFRAEAGFPIGYFWGFETDGVLQNDADVAAWIRPDNGQPYFRDAKPGDLKFVDQNQDGKIDDKDKVMIGNPHPDFIFGLQFNAEYKGFYLQFTGNGQAGHQIAKSYRSADSYRQNFTKEVYDQRWHGENTSDKYPRIIRGGHRNYQYISNMYVYNADFFRISNLTIGYDFKQLIKKMPFSELRVYGAAKNLHTFTKYPGMDPEVGYSPDGYSWGSGIDLGLYPQSRTFMIGLIITY